MDTPYFSQTFSNHNIPIQTYKQKLVIDARNYIPQIASNPNCEFDFNIVLANSNTKDGINVPMYDHCCSAELIGINVPKVENEIYFVLDIDKFTDNIHSSDKGSHDKFAVIFFDGGLNTGDSKPLKGSDFSPKICVFEPPLSSLNKLNIKLRKFGGDIITPLDFDKDFVTPTGTQSDKENNLKQSLTTHPVVIMLEFEIKK